MFIYFKLLMFEMLEENNILSGKYNKQNGVQLYNSGKYNKQNGVQLYN